MKTVPLTIRRCPAEVHQRLKDQARANQRSLNGELLVRLEGQAEEEPVTGAELARRLKKFRGLLTEQEHREFARDIERAIKLMRNERLH